MIPEISSDCFLLNESIRKNKVNTLEKPMLSEGPDRRALVLKLALEGGKRKCLMSSGLSARLDCSPYLGAG